MTASWYNTVVNMSQYMQLNTPDREIYPASGSLQVRIESNRTSYVAYPQGYESAQREDGNKIQQRALFTYERLDQGEYETA
jgi:hypothetical protein